MGTIELANRTDAERTVRVTPGPSLDADPSIVVPPKGVADILVRTKPKENGAINDSVALEGDDFKAEIPVRGAPAPAMAQPLAAATPAPSPSASPVNGPQAAPAPEQQAQPAGESLPPMAPEVAAPEPPASPGTPVFSLVVGNVGENTARVTSDFKTAVPVHAWRLEAQTVGVNAAGMPEAQWQPVDNAALDVNGTKVSATLAHLRPNALYVVRLVGVDEQGRLIALSGPGHIWTPRAPERSYWGWVLLGAAAAAAAGTWRWWTRRPRWAGGL
jgi:hypothetical protein